MPRDRNPYRSDAPRHRSVRRSRPDPGTASRDALPARERFQGADAYRAEREWRRYEGTPQRDLFRELRHRFLERHAVAARWTLDVGSGPGRFTPGLGCPPTRRVALDISPAMLLRVPLPGTPTVDGPYPEVDRLRADAIRPPFPAGTFGEVAVIGNAVGFAGGDARALLAAIEQLVAPGGTLVVEIAPGPGESSNYLHRLPAGSVARLFAAPAAAIVPRIVREGFTPEAVRHRSNTFERLSATRLRDDWSSRGWEIRECLAVAPCLGPEIATIAKVRGDPRAWDHLLAVEEQVGRRPERWTAAAAVLIAVRRGVAQT